MTNRWNDCSIKDKIQDSDISLNEQFNLYLKFNNIKAKCEKYGAYMKAHAFDLLTEEYKPVIVSCNFNISKMAYKYPKKQIRWFRKT